MIDIYNILYGWLTLKIGDCEFTASYINDVKKDLDYLFNFRDKESIKKRVLDGESTGDLLLVTYLTYENINTDSSTDEETYGYLINIVWHELYNSGKEIKVLSFPYYAFRKEYLNLCKEIKDRYIKFFLMPTDKNEEKEMYNEY